MQDNHSFTKKYVMRGLHFQNEPHQQDKLVRVVDGEIYDVVVDIRKDSQTYGCWHGETLSSSNKLHIWVPKGFEHGFISTSEEATILYKTTEAYTSLVLANEKEAKLTDFIDPMRYTFLPNTAGCFNSKDALRTLNLAKEIGGWNMVKLEVLSDEKTLYPDMVQTLEAGEVLVSEGFSVLAYCNDDPILAKKLEKIGCAAIMPLGSPIGSGLGILCLLYTSPSPRDS
mgnify:CR=1 FL=1